MGSGESKGHSKRKTTTSSGFLGRGRQVQVREVGHQKELVLISITSSHLFSLNSLIFCFASISVVLGNRPTGSIVFFFVVLFCFVFSTFDMGKFVKSVSISTKSTLFECERI